MNHKTIFAVAALSLFAAGAQAASGSVAVVQAGSPEAREFSKLNKLSGQLPDRAKAQLAVDASGTPQALVLPAGNKGSVRDQFLKYGAAFNPDGSLALPVTTAKGGEVEIVVAADGTISSR